MTAVPAAGFPDPAAPARTAASPPRPHILMVNGRKVRQPVFVLGSPRSGSDLIARAVKRTPGFHLTLGQPPVLPVVRAFARNPGLARGRAEAAARVLRDAFAQGWQVTPHCCLGCSAACREAGGSTGNGPCVDERNVTRYGDASPDLLYCAESLLDAFPDARLVQVIRDGRDAVAGMLTDTDVLAWFRAGAATADGGTHPLLGVETPDDLRAWEALSPAGKCAMRWRGSVHLMARLRSSLSLDQLVTVRYEDMVRQPAATAAALSAFLRAEVAPTELRGRAVGMEPGMWRRNLTPAQVAEVERVAGEDLRRIGYGA